jgi:RND family efflux transporter MFP subunit
MLITANTSGVVGSLDNSLTPGKKVSSGSKMFSIKPGSLREDNMELKYVQAKSNFDRAKKEYERVSELYKLKITPEREYLDAKSSFENAEAIFKNYSQSSEGKNITIKASKGGYLKRLLVNQGQFVEAGTTLAVISNNNKLMIQIDLPTKEFSKLSNITDANLIIDNNTIKMKELNGKVSGSPISSGSSGFVTLFLQIDNKINLLPNSYISLYLFGSNISNSITAPNEALWEDQGNFFVFVQKNGELFEKREVSINGFDGFNYLIGSGLKNGEVIVTKGAYRVMLASKSSELPSQSHAH